jgi:hypothetical protein
MFIALLGVQVEWRQIAYMSLTERKDFGVRSTINMPTPPE